MKKGFTIIELIIVVAILIIMAGAALSGTGGIIRGLRFSNSFNKIVLMVQRARSLAVTGKNANIKAYEVQFSFASPGTAILQGEKQDGTMQEIERFTLVSQTNLEFTNNLACEPATIRFLNGKAETQLICTGGPSTVVLIEVGLRENAVNAAPGAAAVRSKSFTIHRASGIPQVN